MLSNPVFLYVEDEPFSRLVMETLLVRALHYEQVTIFENSERFIERIEALTKLPDVIFLDIHMLPHSGFEMLTMLGEHPAYNATRIIALTASVMNEEVESLKTAGFNGAISKPIDQLVFPQLLQKILDGEEVWHIK
jgi:CheY-like chemotaxis protein